MQYSTSMDPRIAAFIHYYAREGYLHHLKTVCNEVIKRSSSPSLQFWRAYALLASGTTTEAIRELHAVQSHPDTEVAATAALLAAHQTARVVDYDAIAEMTANLELKERGVYGIAALNLAACFLYMHSFERARTVLERQLTELDRWQEADAARLRTLLGFVLLEQQAHEVVELQDVQDLHQALHLFNAVLQRDPNDLEALLGKARALEATDEARLAWELLSEAAVRLPWAVPVLMELARLTLAQCDWDTVAEVVSRLQEVDSNNVMAIAYTALGSLLLDGNSKATHKHLMTLMAEIHKSEPTNVELMLQWAAPFARLAGSDDAVLDVTYKMVERAQQLQPDNVQCVVEAAAQNLLLDQPAAAIAGFEAALKLNELHLKAAMGLVEAYLAAGQLTEALQQLQFLPELLAASRAAGGLMADSHVDGKVLFGFAGSRQCLANTAAAVKRSSRSSDDQSAGSMQLVAGGISDLDRVEVEEPLLLYLKGMLAWKQGQQQEGLQQLQRYMEVQLRLVEDMPYGLAMFTALHATRIFGVIRLLLDSVGGDPRQASDPPSSMLANCIRVLEMLSRYTHNHSEAQLLGARALYLNGAFDAAVHKASAVLKCNSDSTQAALLVVSVHVRQGRPTDAMAALEAAVSANFSIRETPLYQVVRAQVLLVNGQLEEAKRVLEAALALPGVRGTLNAEQAARLAKKGCLPSLHERASIYLLLVEVVGKLTRSPDSAEAKKYLAEAVREFTGTREEVRVMVADCEDAIAGGDVAGALKRLRRVPESSPQYTRARMAMADIHLRHRKDQAAYIQCYIDLVDKNPDYDNHCLLAEAFLAIQQPDKAVGAYESALALRAKDSDLALAAAQALVAAHNYNRAIDYYNRAIRNYPDNLVLQHGLARLLLRLGQTRQATGLLDKCLEAHKSKGLAASSPETLAQVVDTWLLLAKLEEQKGNADAYLAAQEQALKLQTSILGYLRDPGGRGTKQTSGADSTVTSDSRKRSGLATDDFAGGFAAFSNMGSSRAKAASICFDMAECYRKHRQFDKAEASYKACLQHQEKHTAAKLALARLALATGQVEACQKHAAALLEDQPDNEDAAIMLAELMAHQDNHDAALYYLQQLLDKKPCHYTALVQLLGLLRRAGKLSEADKYIKAAESRATGGPQGSTDSSVTNLGGGVKLGGAADGGGLSYCKGVLQRYLNDPREALKHFNAARRDMKWSSLALLAMAETYLNPVNEVSWASEASDDETQGATVQAQLDEGATEAVQAAGALLQQLHPADMEGSKYKLLSAYTLMASKSRPDIEAAVGQLLDMANTDPNNVPVLMGLAHGFLLLKQTAKARNQLKRVAKLPYKAEEADEFERAWLALADIHIAGGKYDLAQELCNRCLKYNKSCSKAWELLGAIAEREQAYKDAASYYERAWSLTSQTSPSVGYKLAFNYMKAGRLVDAICVAQAVLKVDPQYPKIKQDVLEKSRLSLKP